MGKNVPVITGQEQAKALSKQAAQHDIDNTRADDIQSAKIEDGVFQIKASREAHDRIDQALGSSQSEFQSYCITHLVNIIPDSAKKDEDFTSELRSTIAMLEGIAPADPLEAMLAVQMVATHHMVMMSTRRSLHNTTMEGRQLNGNLATKFSRTFVAQMEALGKHRRKGEQVVRHVTVAEGGQAVIANNVNTGGQNRG